jgi:hypothetical protein
MTRPTVEYRRRTLAAKPSAKLSRRSGLSQLQAWPLARLARA